MTDDEAFTRWLEGQAEAISGSEVFCQLYSPHMADFLADPGPAVQLALAILMDKPIIVACLPGRKPPAKLLALADAVVYGEPRELARGVQEAVQRLAP
jgi:hypothetical protein